ncbi:MAG: hypothetical protein R2712_23625 [Vicinamibacterales bacterium]
MPPPALPDAIEDYRDHHWFRDETRRVETAQDAERFVEHVGFAACLTDARRPARRCSRRLRPARCRPGRETCRRTRRRRTCGSSLTRWCAAARYYGSSRGKATFVAPRLVPAFHALGVRRSEEADRLSADARRLLAPLRREGEMSTRELREASGVSDRARFTRALDELQAAMIVVPADVVYQPFTYLWTLAVGRFPDQLRRRLGRDAALREIAAGFLAGAGMTVPGELARVSGLSRPDAGLGNRALVETGLATSPARGTYQLAAGLPGAF